MYWLILFAALLFIAGYIVQIFNRFATLRNRVKDAWSNIDVALKLRHDLIPNLVNTVKGYAQHEQTTLNRVIQARALAMATPATDRAQKIQAENQLHQALGQLFALSEAYPDLKASSNFLSLQQQLAEVEEKIERSRRFYNSMVRENNIYGEQFPAILFRDLFHFQHFDYYEAAAGDRENINVDFAS